VTRGSAKGCAGQPPWRLDAVDLVLTAACNLRCVYCYQATKRPGRMRWPIARAALGRLLESREGAGRLCLTGGEPLLAAPLVRRVVRHVRSRGPSTRRIGISLLTNGTLLDERMIRFLAANDVAVQISMDGVAAAQALRGAWTFGALDALFGRLAARHPRWFRRRVSVAITLTPAAVRHFAQSIEYLLSRGIREIGVAPALGVSPTRRRRWLTELDRQFRRVLAASLAHAKRTGRVPLRLFRTPFAFRADPSDPMCGLADGFRVSVDVDGRVYGCPLAVPRFGSRISPILRRASAAMLMGRIEDPGLPEALPAYGDALRATGVFGPRGSMRSFRGLCRSCRYLDRCAICPLSIAYAPGARSPTRVPDFACAFSWAALRYRDRFSSEALRLVPAPLGSARRRARPARQRRPRQRAA